MRSRFLFPAIALLLAAPAAFPAATYSGLLITNACGTRTETSAIGITQVDTGSNGGLACTSTAQNAAGAGQLRIFALSEIAGGAGSSTTQTNARASLSIDDLIITGSAATASGALLIRVDGILDLATSLSGSQNAANTSADWLLNINSTWGQGEIRRRIGKTIGGGTVNDQPTSESSSGILTGYAGGSTVIALPFTNVPTNTPQSFFLTVLGQMRAQAGGCGPPSTCESWTADSSALLNFLNTVSLVSGEAAFVFDSSGFLANSTGLNVVDNFWQGATAVPLPGTFGLLALAMAGLGGAMRRRTR